MNTANRRPFLEFGYGVPRSDYFSWNRKYPLFAISKLSGPFRNCEYFCCSVLSLTNMDQGLKKSKSNNFSSKQFETEFKEKRCKEMSVTELVQVLQI